MEAEAFILGHWKNFEEIEENICLPELEMIIDAAREAQYNQNKFLAALKGVNLEEGKPNRVEEIKNKLRAEASGMSEEQFEINGMFGFESEGE